jgi:hypothetical protein
MHASRFDSETWVLTVSNKELRLLELAMCLSVIDDVADEDQEEYADLWMALMDAVTELNTVPTAPPAEVTPVAADIVLTLRDPLTGHLSNVTGLPQWPDYTGPWSMWR